MIHTSDPTEDCICNPTMIPIKRPDGSMNWVIAHNEPGQTEAQQADRTSKIFEAMDELRS